MAWHSWDYRGPFDLLAMQDVVSRLWQPGARWHVGDVAWRRFQHVGREPQWRTRLWGDDGVLAWAWCTGDYVELVIDRDARELLPEILQWAGPRAVEVADRDAWLREGLVAAGYRSGSLHEPFVVRLIHTLSSVPALGLPDGYRFVEVSDARVGARVATHRAGFRPSRVTVQSYRQVRSCWPYRRDLDVAVADSQGVIVSFCLAWYDPGSDAGLIEPVATRPAHRRRGLAGAACTEALRRLQEAGATVVTVATRGDAAYPQPLRLYQRIGFRPASRDITYTPAHGDTRC